MRDVKAFAKQVGVRSVNVWLKELRRFNKVERSKKAGSAAFAAEADTPDEFGDMPKPDRDMTIRNCVLDHIGKRQVKTAMQIHNDVAADFGRVTLRSVHRALAYWVVQRRVFNVSKGRDRRGLPLPGGYVLADSPLVWSKDGMTSLMSMLEDID